MVAPHTEVLTSFPLQQLFLQTTIDFCSGLCSVLGSSVRQHYRRFTRTEIQLLPIFCLERTSSHGSPSSEARLPVIQRQ
jgi:hypothetical protein